MRRDADQQIPARRQPLAPRLQRYTIFLDVLEPFEPTDHVVASVTIGECIAHLAAAHGVQPIDGHPTRGIVWLHPDVVELPGKPGAERAFTGADFKNAVRVSRRKTATNAAEP